MGNKAGFDYNLIEEYLSLQGIEPLGKPLKDSHEAFSSIVQLKGEDKESGILKIAKTNKQAKYFRNQARFNRYFTRKMPRTSKVAVPEILADGVVGKGLYYLIEEKIEGKPFAVFADNLSLILIEKPDTYFQHIISAIDFVQSQRNVFKIKKRTQTEWKKRLLDKATDWIDKQTPYGTRLIKLIRELKAREIKAAPIHGDFTPINLFIGIAGRLYILDAERAGRGIIYYDYAEFCNRLWTRVLKPELAKKFLQQVYAAPAVAEREQFISLLPPLLAFRAIGNFYEYRKIHAVNKPVRLKFLTSFAEFVVEGKFNWSN